MNKILNGLLDFVYPKKCVFCESVVPFGSGNAAVCGECERHIPFLKENICKKCGIVNVERPGLELCERCLKADFVFKRNYAVFEYEKVRGAIRRFKYDKIKYLGDAFVDLMIKYIYEIDESVIKDIDVIVPVPLSPSRMKERGFNHMELISATLSEALGIPADFEVLTRIHETLPQSSLKFSERAKNVKGAFAVKDKARVKGKRILLTDDIFTSGATINECAGVLLKAGASEIRGFTISVASGRRDNC